MNILIVTLGSRGDVQPYVALGKGLQAAGHTVTVCTAASFETFITEHGLRYGYLNNELLDLMDTAEGRAAMEEAVGVFGSVKTMIKLAKESSRIYRQILKETWAAAQAAEPDLIIYHPKAFGVPHIAEKLGIPAILTASVPMIVPTAAMPPIGIPALKLGGGYNKLGYKLITMGYSSYRGMINTFREETLGLGKLPRSQDVLTEVSGQPVPVLHAYSQHMIPRPHDWPDYAHVNGFWFLDDAENWQPAAELQAFLDAGDPPVYVGFGSMAGRNPDKLARTVIRALQQANVRGIIATGWGGLQAGDLPETIFKIDQAPHDWLFPRVAAVVHHGGAGTTAEGLRAGVPAVTVPFVLDQPFWGARIKALGVGPEPVPRKNLTVDRLAAAISQAVTDPAMRQRAAACGAAIRAEEGVGNAVALIQRYLAAPSEGTQSP
ncbi:MAG: glycosyltransferase family 1 protein [Anaerolineae bacterium]|nr:glycosyltransferase family 1 protein [Anaerolineae bacterium]